MDMKKFLTLSFLSMFVASQANAGFISVITGADMAGMEVTATFAGGSSETLTWAMLTPRDASTDSLGLETASGGVSSAGFSLSQQGDSHGNFTSTSALGLWTLTNNSSLTIETLLVNAIAGNVVFDTLFDVTLINGSGIGRQFTEVLPNGDPPAAPSATHAYSSVYQEELYGAMTLNLSLTSGQSLTFFADTDIVVVSAPTTFSLLMFSLFGLMINSRRKQAQGDINV
jgi:hypothetical protein